MTLQLAEWTAYFDESFGRANAYAVAGYIAPARQWTEFEREWKRMLVQEDITILHKADFETFVEGTEYEKFRQLPIDQQLAKKTRVNKRAIGIIHRRLNAGFTAAVIKTDWDEFDKGRWGSQMGHGYYAAGAKACLHQIGVWAKRFGYGGPIDYIFESGPETGELAKFLNLVAKDAELREVFYFNNWGFAHKTERMQNGVLVPGVVPLQAADFLAYETYRELDNRRVEGIKLDKNGKEYLRRGAFRHLLQQPRKYSIVRDERDPWYAYRGLDNDKKPTPHFNHGFDKESIADYVRFLDEKFPD